MIARIRPLGLPVSIQMVTFANIQYMTSITLATRYLRQTKKPRMVTNAASIIIQGSKRTDNPPSLDGLKKSPISENIALNPAEINDAIAPLRIARSQEFLPTLLKSSKKLRFFF